MSATDVTGADTETAPPRVTERRLIDTVRARWPARRIWTLLAPALIFLGIREFGLLVLTWMAAATGRSVTEALRSWDGQWFLAIAESGYEGVPAGLVDAFGNRSAETPLAFFPGYPMVVRWFAAIDGDGGIGLVTAAFTVTIAFGVACAYALARLGRHIRGGSPRTGLILVALFAASPMSIVLVMAYSEAMFCALAAWSLVGVLERRWVLAGVCCAAAGLVRSTGAALVLAVGLAVIVAVVRRRDGWRPWVGGVIAPVGLLGYLAWVGVRTGEWNGWFGLQERGWGTGFDGGVATVTFSLEALADARSVLEVTTVGLIVVALVLLVVGFKRRVEWPLMVYAAGVLVMDLGSNGLMNSKARLMVPAFTLLIPVATALAKRKPSTAVLTLCALVVAGSWFGAYSITSWGYAI
ncbi:mannosyltransferase family protein [Actinophytocola gossypii]|uniref:mannosyltransferase family protein n=1 Tax=Actinophytocola gossypii TaxID=2812003 RepID=UPI0021A7FB2E|nr:mannosyltransferase family protein [Actinophytocola gossypii]